MKYFCLVTLSLAFRFIFLEVSHISMKSHRVSVAGKAPVPWPTVPQGLLLF